jgi:hypothetical protein
MIFFLIKINRLLYLKIILNTLINLPNNTINNLLKQMDEFKQSL